MLGKASALHRDHYRSGLPATEVPAGGLTDRFDHHYPQPYGIGQLAKRAETEGYEVAIASSDKDFFQLVNDQVKMLNPADKSGEPMDAAAVEAKTGVQPHQIVDWLSLVGDAADNIPGVPGIGVKTAATLLNEFGSVDGIYERLAEVKREKQREALAASKKDVRRNQELVALKLDLPGEPQLDSLRKGFEDSAQLRKLYNKWGFEKMNKSLKRHQDQVYLEQNLL